MIDVFRSRILIAATFAAGALSACWFAVEARYGFSLWDEGFLWYGVRRVMAGEVPIRDFMSYDIGRYYLSAAMMALLGSDGLFALRVSLGIIQALAVGLATYLVLKDRDDDTPLMFYALLAAIIFTSWMVLQFRVTDSAAAITLIAALSFALQKPAPFRWFVAGLACGLVAMIGRNHGVYGVAGLVGALLIAHPASNWRDAPRAVVAAWAGVLIGYLPNLVMLLLVPGLAKAFWADIAFVFRMGSTNLALPVPWPWTAFGPGWPTLEVVRAFLLGTFFLALPLFGVCSLVWMMLLRRSDSLAKESVFAATALLALPYAHYAFSRADLAHLGIGIFPLLIGVLTLPRVAAFVRFVVAGILTAASVFVTAPIHPAYVAALERNWHEASIDGDTVTVSTEVAGEVALLNRLAQRYACHNETFLAAPVWPGAYALLGRKAPVWEIYPLFNRDAAFQEAEISRITAARPAFVVLNEEPVDGRLDLLYERTHPLIDQYIRDNFRIVAQEVAFSRLRLYVRDTAEQGCAR